MDTHFSGAGEGDLFLTLRGAASPPFPPLAHVCCCLKEKKFESRTMERRHSFLAAWPGGREERGRRKKKAFSAVQNSPPFFSFAFGSRVILQVHSIRNWKDTVVD